MDRENRPRTNDDSEPTVALPGAGASVGAEPGEPGLQLHPDIRKDYEARASAARDGLEGIPERIGSWKLVRMLGQGASGNVALAVSLDTGERVAVKLSRSQDDHVRESFRAEAHALRAASHPGLPRLVDAGSAEGVDYLALEYVEGQDLAHVVENAGAGTISGAQILDWFIELAGAVEALHEAGLLHRDIKPANIMIGADGTPKLIDFGLSWSVGARYEGFVGTLRFMSLEQILNGPVVVSESTDVYALAGAMHFALMAKPWVPADSLGRLLTAIAYQTPPMSDWACADVPPQLIPVLRKALAKDPRTRHQNARQFREDLELVRAGRSPRHADEPTRDRIERIVRTHPRAAAALTAVVLCGLAWTAWGAIASAREREDLLTSARAHLDASRPAAALAALRPHAETHRGDGEFAALFGRAVAANARTQIEEMLARVAFAIPELEIGYGYAAQVRHARQDLEFARTHELVLILALDAYLRGEFAAATQLLHEHAAIASSSTALRDLRTVIELRAPSPSLQPSTIKTALSAPEPGHAAACLRALLCCHILPHLQSEHADESPHLREQALTLTGRVLEAVPDHTCARAVRALIHLDAAEYPSARNELEVLQTHLADADEPGFELQFLVALLGSTPATPPDPRHTLAASLTRRLGQRDSRLTERVSTELALMYADPDPSRRATGATAQAWIEALGREPRVLTLETGALRQVVFSASLQMFERRDTAALTRFCELLRSRTVHSDALRGDVCTAHESLFYAHCYDLVERVRSRDLDAAAVGQQVTATHLAWNRASVVDADDQRCGIALLAAFDEMARRLASGGAEHDDACAERLESALRDQPDYRREIQPLLEWLRTR